MTFGYTETARQILEMVGRKANVGGLTCCITRLRFTLKGMGLPKDLEVEKIPGVLRVIKQGGQYQVVIGNRVTHMFAELQKLSDFSDGRRAKNGDSRESLFSGLRALMVGCMTPLLPAMLGCGMIKVILTLLTAFSLVDTTGGTYIILDTVGDAFFYFMPIMLACITAERPNSNPSLAMVMTAVLLHPDLGALFLQGNTSCFGPPVASTSYSSSVLPVLLMIPSTRWTEGFADRIYPDMMKMFLGPLIAILVSVPVVLIVIGPIGAIVRNYLADGVNFLYNKVDWLIIAVLSAIMPFIVMTGMHYTLIPICTISLANSGYDVVLITAMFCSNLAQDGASMAIAIRTKDNIVESTALAAGISAIVTGVTEPAMYGITLKCKTSMITAVCGAGASGLYSGITHLVGCTMGGSSPVLALIQMIGGEGLANLLNGVITLVISLGVSFLASLALYKPDPAEAGEKEAAGTEEARTPPQEIKPLAEHTEIKSPLNGAVISLKEASDPVSPGGVLGEGATVIPSDGKVYAPADGMTSTVMDSKHAVGITVDNQAEILIHVGLDTTNLKGEGFNLHCKMGNRMKVGGLLLEFSLSLLKEKGYDAITPVLIFSPTNFISIKTAETKEIAAGEVLLTVI